MNETSFATRLQAALRQSYTIERELGGGGMSRVFVATETGLRRRVVIKVLLPELAAGVSADRFRREVQLVASLQHPHIVPLFSAGSAGDLLYYTMPLVEGESLRSRISREGQLPISDTLSVLRNVVDALAYAHERHIVHRDIKPDNVLLSHNHALVTDFGIAKALSEASASSWTTTSTGLALGTPSYMAPEQVTASPDLDHRVDIYAVGALAYEMLSGRPPFSGSSAQAVLAAHVTQAPEPLDRIRAGIPHSLSATVMRCLEKLPENRPQRAAELLQQIAADTPQVGLRLAKGRGRLKRRTTILAAIGTGAVVTAGFMVLKRFEFGPKSLLASGVVQNRERVVMADFVNRTGDPLLGDALTQAFRIDFAQSPVVRPLESQQVRQIFQRMSKPDTARLDLPLALEVALREGVKAVVAGEIDRAGQQFVVSAQLVSADSGSVLAAFRESARDSSELIQAVDRLSKRLRKRIGESLRSLHTSPPLARVTTSSLEALRKYSQGMKVTDAGDVTRGVALLEEAIALDSGFASAYRAIGITLGNYNEQRDREIQALSKAFEYRDRLPPRERYLATSAYHAYVTGDRGKAKDDLRTLLDLFPDNATAMNNLAAMYAWDRDNTESAKLYQRAAAFDSSNILFYTNLAGELVSLGRVDSARAVLQQVRRRFPLNPLSTWYSALLYSSLGNYDSATAAFKELAENAKLDPNWRSAAEQVLGDILTLRGRPAEGSTWVRRGILTEERRGAGPIALERAAEHGVALALQGETKRPAADVEALLRRHPLTAQSPADRPYLDLVLFYSLTRNTARAGALLTEYERTIPVQFRRDDEPDRHVAHGFVALAEGKPEKAITEFRAGDEGPCRLCPLPGLGQAYDLEGKPDSALQVYESYVRIPSLYRVFQDRFWLPGIYYRLGELHEQRHNREQAAEYYGRFIRLWKDADPTLQLRVAAAKRRLAGLAAEPR